MGAIKTMHGQRYRCMADGGIVKPLPPARPEVTTADRPDPAGVRKGYADGGIIASLVGKVTKPFSKPEGYTPASAAPPPAAAPAPAPAPTRVQLGGVNMQVNARREAAAGMADGGPVKQKGVTPSKVPDAAKDTVPIMAQPGEAMLPVDTVEAIGGEKTIKALIKATHKPAKNKGKKKGPIRKMADGGLVKRKRSDEIPTGGLTAPAADGLPEPGDVTRNINNGLSAMGGMGVVASVPLRAAAPALTRALPALAGPATNAMTTTGGPIAQYAQQLPRAIPGLMEGAQANAAAGAARAVGNASSAANAADANQAAPLSTTPTPAPTPATPATTLPTAGAPAAAAAPAAPAPAAPPVPAAGAAPDGTMPYGQQMANVGGAILDAAGNVAKTIVSYPGYGFNRNAAPGPIAAMAAGVNPADARLAAGTQASPGAVVAQPGAVAAPAPALPAWNGKTGTAVAEAPGVRKIVQHGRTLYSNVADGSNDTMMSGNGGGTVTVLPSGPIAQLSAGTDQALSAARAAAAARGDTEGLAASYGTPAGSRSSGQTLREQLAGRKLTRKGVEAMVAADNADATVANSHTMAKRLEMDTQAHSQDSVLKASQVKLSQQMDSARSALLGAKTDSDKEAAKETLRALQGKYEREFPNRYTVANGGQEVIDGQLVHIPSRVLDNQTGQFLDTTPPSVKAAPPAGAVAKLKANPKLQADFDAKYGAGAAAKAMAQK